MKFFLILYLFALNCFGCEITPNSSYLKLGKMFFPSLEKAITKDCKESEINEFIDKLSSLDGNIPTSYIADDMTNKNIKFNVSNINVIDLQKSFNISGSDFAFQNTTMTSPSYPEGHLTLLKVDCSNCDLPGKKTFKVTLKDSQKNFDVWVNSVFQKKISYLKAKENIFDIDTPLSESNFVRTETYTSDPQLYFSDFEKIKFYRPATKISKDMALKNDLLVKNYLVKQGNAVDVILKNDILSITNRGQAMANGKYGETIRVRTANKKELSGIIKDFNQVEVQL